MAAEKPEIAVLTPDQQEAILVASRIAELDQNPIKGNFDADHLRAINRHLFQDMPGIAAKAKEYDPGNYRPKVPAGQDWIKQRRIETVGESFVVCYSRMDAKAIKELETALKDAHPSKLKELKTGEFIKAISELYTKLDYVHPFKDGNSRTLRSFTTQLGREAGFDVDWRPFAANRAGHDVLYIARDLGVNKLAESKGFASLNTQRHVAYQLAALGECQSLEKVLADKIRPARAISFERDSKEFALQKHPELRTAFSVLEKAEAAIQKQFTGQPENLALAQKQAKETVQRGLDAGETKRFAPEKAQAKEQPLQKQVRVSEEPERGTHER